MSGPTAGPAGPDGVLRPRTISPGGGARSRVVRPRTVKALGRPDPIVSLATSPSPAEPAADAMLGTGSPAGGATVDLSRPVTDEARVASSSAPEPLGASAGTSVAPASPDRPTDADSDLWVDDRTGEIAVVHAPDEDLWIDDLTGEVAGDRAPIEDVWVDEVSGEIGVRRAPPDPVWVDDEPRGGPEADEPAAVPEPVERGTDTPGAPGATGTTQARQDEPPRMLRNNLFVASGTAVSRLTGLIRTSLIFALLGKSLADTYVNANVTPNMIYELILGGVLTATLVPLFTDDLERGDRGEATSAIISFAIVALVGVALLAAVVSPLLMLLFSFGSPDVSRDDYISAGIPLALLFAPQVFFYGLMAVWSAVLNSRHRFLAAAWAPVLNNLITIATLVVVWQMTTDTPSLADALADRKIILVLGLGTTAGIAIMAMALGPSIRRADIGFRFRFTLQHPAVRRALRLSGWTFGYVVANQIALVVITILSKPGSGGSVDYQTAFQFFQLPHGLLAVSIMVTFEPLLGRADARADRREFNRQLLLGFRLIGLLVIPAAVGYIALPKGLDYRTFSATGNLDRAFGLTGIIAAFAVGLPGFSSYLFTLRAFYAMKDTRIPFLINCFENAVNIVVAVVLVRFWGIVGLALSFAIAYTLAATVAIAVLVRRSPGFYWQGLVRTWVELLTAAALMGGVVFGLLVLVAPGSLLAALPTVLGAILAGGLVYLGAILVLRVAGISELFGRLPLLRRFGYGA